MVQGKAIQELEGGQARFDTVDKGGCDRAGGEDAGTVEADLRRRQRGAATAHRTHGLAKAEGVDQNLDRPTGRVKRRGRIGGGREALGAEERFRTGSDNHSVEVGGVRLRIRRIDPAGKELAHDDHVNIGAGEAAGEALALADAVVVVDRSENANSQTVDPHQWRTKRADVRSLVIVVECRVCLRHWNTDHAGNPSSQIVVDSVDLGDEILLDNAALNVGGLESEAIDEELLLGRGQRVIEQTGLRPDVCEGRADLADETAIGKATRGREKAPANSLVRLRGKAVVQCVRGVRGLVQRNKILGCL